MSQSGGQQPNFDRVVTAWGKAAPQWVLSLARICDRTSQARAAKAIGYSGPVVNQVLMNTYRGNLAAVQKAVEGAFQNAEVQCPVMGAIKANKCISEQRIPLRGTNAQRIAIWNACRDGCPNFLGQKGEK
jgi:hypothetical protein